MEAHLKAKHKDDVGKVLLKRWQMAKADSAVTTAKLDEACRPLPQVLPFQAVDIIEDAENMVHSDFPHLFILTAKNMTTQEKT
jgi:hypothetical protein